jgi:formate-dependent nitrite reductase membrane component NrfD
VTESQSYYGRPILKEPTWTPEVPAYLFTGGIAGGCAVLHGFARLTRNDDLARATLRIGAAMEIVSPILLISDLGRPERFLNMLRVFKVTSPMSVGSWILVVSGGAGATAAALEQLGLLAPLKALAEAVWFASGPPLATYTGALLANTANPVWSEARGELPWLFGASATAAAGAAAAIATPGRCAGPARRAAVGGAVAELALTRVMEQRLGFVGEVYGRGEAGSYGRVSKILTTAGAALLAARGHRSRAAAVTGGALVLAGGLALRFSVFKAGFQSARDPKYTVVPQKERAATRRREARPASDRD